MKQYLIILTIITLIIIRLSSDAVSQNIAYLSFNWALGQTSVNRTYYLGKFASFWQQKAPQSTPTLLYGNTISPIQQFFIGRYYHIQGDLTTAIHWYSLAAQHSDEFIWPSLADLQWQHQLTSDGHVLLDDFKQANLWRKEEGNSNITNLTFQVADSVTYINFTNQLQQRDRLAYSLYPNWAKIPIGYHQILAIRVKISPDSYFTLETVIDDLRTRHLNYIQGNGEWQIIKIPLSGNILKEVKIILSEPVEMNTATQYQFWFDWIKLELPTI
jgi:hypothetical protein